MGSRPSSKVIYPSQELSKSYELVTFADREFDESIISSLVSQPPLSTYTLQNLILKKIEKSRSKLLKQFLNIFPATKSNSAVFISLHISRCKAKTGYFDYINSMRSLHFAHVIKQEVITKELIKKSRSKSELLDYYLKNIRGCFSLQGLCELEELIESDYKGFKILVLLFRQTFDNKKNVESQLLNIKGVDKSDIIPHGFETVQESVQESLYQLQFPNIH
jgi:hypothetical protein